MLIPVGNQIEVIPSNRHVGKITNNVEFKVARIELALEQIASTVKTILWINTVKRPSFYVIVRLLLT